MTLNLQPTSDVLLDRARVVTLNQLSLSTKLCQESGLAPNPENRIRVAEILAANYGAEIARSALK